MHRTAVRLVLAAFALTAGPLAATAQEVPPYAPATEAHGQGRWSMQFEVGPDFQLSNFNGAGIAVTHNTSESAAWRLGLNLALEDLDQNIEGSPYFGGDSDQGDTYVAVDVDLLRLKRYQPARRIGFELGVGPVISYAHMSEDFVFGDENESVNGSFESARGFLGLAGRLGGEVMLARSLSVHAHYSLRAGYQRQRYTTHQVRVNTTVDSRLETEIEDIQNRWVFRPEGILLGLSVYL